MPQMARCLSTSRPRWQFFSQRIASDALLILVKQASFRNHNDVAGAQRDVTFEVSASFVGLVIEHEYRFVAARRPSPHLDAALGSKGAYPAGKGNCLHQCCRLANHI